MPKDEKTLIGVLASHDCPKKNEVLAKVFRYAFNHSKEELKYFRFAFTGGTYNRLFRGIPPTNYAEPIKNGFFTVKKNNNNDKIEPDEIAYFLHNECGVVTVPPKDEGGVIILASLITQRKISIIWPFFSPYTAHLLYPDNLALLRLADQWHAKKLLNTGSVEEWLNCEACRDKNLNLQEIFQQFDSPCETHIEINTINIGEDKSTLTWKVPDNTPEKLRCDIPKLEKKDLQNATIALISHDEMKDRMIDFVIDYEHELEKFKNILATGTTGKLIKEACPKLRDNVKLYHSGPKGGDIEIATEILVGACHLVIFFVDPLHAHPHIEDVRVVFSACMIRDKIPILSNEMQARAWMDHRIRGV